MTNPTPHGQVPAIQRYSIGYHSDEWGVRSSTLGGIPDPSGQWVRYEDHAAEFQRLHAYCQELEAQVIRDCMTHVQNPADTNTASGAADSDDALMARELYESQDDSLLLCASDLQHSAIYDNHAEMQSCMRAVAERITALASAPAQPVAEPAGATSNTHWNQAPCAHCGCTEGQHFNARCHHIQGETRYTPTAQAAPATQQTGEVHGDLLPKIGSRVFIRHGRDEHAHACIVTGYYAWGDLKGDKRLHRVFVRMAYEGTSIEQARMLCDCYPTAGAALAAAPQPSPTAQAAPAAGAVAGPTDDEILNRTGTPYAPGTREYDLDLIRWYRERLAAAPTPAAQAAESVPATANNKLLPCPCCGGEAAEHDRFNSNTVRCLSCGLRAKQSEMGMGDAAARWNTRAARAPAESVPAPPPPPECETEAEKRAFAFGWFKAQEADRAARDPAESVLKDHQIAALVNELRDIAVQYHGTQQLRERIAQVVVPALRAASSVLEDAARLDFLIEQRAYVVSDPDTCPGYWLHFVHKETGKCWVQADEHPTPRAAIDAARKQGGAT